MPPAQQSHTDSLPADLKGPELQHVVVDEHVIEVIARRVAAILREEEQRTAQASKRLVGADELAEMFSVSRTWVYDNAAFLGAIKLGTGSKPRLRFDPHRVREILMTGARAHATTTPRPRRRSRWIDDADLIPISQ